MSSKNGYTANWSEARVEKVTALWADGYSAALIAREIGGFDDYQDGGRCAVIGKLHRLALLGNGEKPRHTLPRGNGHRRVKFGIPVPRTRAVLGVRVKPLRQRPARIVIAEPQEAPQSRKKSIVALRSSECKWPSGDGPYTFCGHPAKPGSVYCAWHHSVSYTKATQRDVDRIASRAMGSIRGHDKSTVMEA